MDGERCSRDDAPMEEVTTDFEYKGIIVQGVKALRCSVCGETLYTLKQTGDIRRRIEALLKPLKLRRRIASAGKRPAIYIPEDVVRNLHLKTGDEIDIYTDGDRIIIEPVKTGSSQ